MKLYKLKPEGLMTRRIVCVGAVVFIIFMSGCTTIYDGGGTPTSTNSIVDHSPTPDFDVNNTEIETPSDPENTELRSNLTSTELEYRNSTQWFGKTVGLNFDDHEHTEYITSKGYPDNTVGIAIQTNEKSSLDRSILDGAQIVAAMTVIYTSNNKSFVQNGTTAPVHQPEMVKYNLHNSNGELVGRFEVDPALARKYREGNATSKEFANTVTKSYKKVNSYDLRGEHEPKYYLNRSELDIWMNYYVNELLSSDDFYENPYPVDGLQVNASRFEVLNEFEYNSNVYGQNYISARATALGAYWRTYIKSFARTPERLNIYMHRSDGSDVVVYMDREYVVDLALKLDQGEDRRGSLEYYQNQAESRFLDDDETAFEDF